MDERTPWPDAEAKSLGPHIAGKDDTALHHVEGQKADATITAPDAEAIYGPTRPETEVQAVEAQAVAAAAASVAPDSLQAEVLEAAAPRGQLPWDIADTATHAAHDDAPPRALAPSHNFGFDELEDGIASIFAALQAKGGADADDSTADDREPADDAVTFLLLGELDRLWHRPDR